jgi:soluble epoxide hydrolase/lipid-phosphate phosphatase
MDPQDPASFNHRTELLSTGRTYHFVDQLPSNYDPNATTTLLCIHGFPDLWYGYRNQIGPWVCAGNRVIVPDMLGYGGTDMPLDSKEYSTKRLTNDLAALLDLLSVQKAVRDGHDTGYTSYRMDS